MFDRRILKGRAKYVLARTFMMSVIACALVNLVAGSGLMNAIPNLQSIDLAGMSDVRKVAIYGVVGLMALAAIGIFIFLAAPLKVGLKYFMLRGADLEANLENITYPFKRNYKNILWVTFVKNLYVFLWSIPGIIPVLVGTLVFNLDETVLKLLNTALLESSFITSFKLTLISTAMFILTAIFMIPAFIKELQYSMVEYILAENPDTKRSVAIGRSKEMMVGNKWAYVKLTFSFFGWYVLANSILCGIGIFILNPYIEATFAQMYLEISGQGKDYPEYDFTNPFGGFGNI